MAAKLKGFLVANRSICFILAAVPATMATTSPKTAGDLRPPAVLSFGSTIFCQNNLVGSLANYLTFAATLAIAVFAASLTQIYIFAHPFGKNLKNCD